MSTPLLSLRKGVQLNYAPVIADDEIKPADRCQERRKRADRLRQEAANSVLKRVQFGRCHAPDHLRVQAEVAMR